MSTLPTGTVTFLFTDLEGSTRLWEEYPEAMQDALARHDSLVRDAIESHHGHVVKMRGDGAHGAFATASDAVDAAVAAQLALTAENWGVTGPLAVRMGIHTGAAELRDDDYFGTTLNRAARIESIAHGGQILVSLTTRDLLRETSTVLADLGEHRLRDLGTPEHIFQVVHRDLQGEFGPLHSVENFPTNLPLQTTSFVGRDDDMTDVIEALGSARLVTLTGVGGVGKTRLAIQVAAEVLPQYPDGTWLCELGPLGDPEAVPDVVATALGVQPRPGMTTSASISDALRTKRILVVLDNCEHLISAAARLVNGVLATCPDVRVLATSREGLGVRGERQMSVRSLDASTESVELFVDRAHEAGGTVDASIDPAVEQICVRLDGIPLALELAAARTRMMTPAEIALRLDERFRLLTGGSRTAVERHQTLRQAVDWSYDLLGSREREILNRLGVFAGGFTLDATAFVVGGDGFDALDVLDGVSQLVDKSLVVAERNGEATRYRLLETIRQYALERLDEAGMSDTTRRRHAEWCAIFAEQAAAGMRSPDEVRWIANVHREVDNLRAGVTWAADIDDADLALRQVGHFNSWFLMSRSLGYRLCPLAAIALSTTDALEHPRAGLAVATRAIDHFHHDQLDEAELDARASIGVLGAQGSERTFEPWTVLMQSLVFGDDKTATLHEEVSRFLAQADATTDPHCRAVALSAGAGFLLLLSEPEAGISRAEEALAIARSIGNPDALNTALFALGGAIIRQEPDRARTVLFESIRHGRQVGSQFFVGMALGRIARIGVGADAAEWAEQFRGAVDLYIENGDHRNVNALLDTLRTSLANAGRSEAATVMSGYLRSHTRHTATPLYQTMAASVEATLAAALGPDRFDQLMAQGAAMDFAAAVSLCHAELDRMIEA